MSQRIAVQACPIPCGWESEVGFPEAFRSQPPVLIESYVAGWIVMFREYGRLRSPGPVRGSWYTTYG
jgi:hypothetical protein